MLTNQKLSEGITICDVFAPISQGAGTVTTPNWIAVGTFDRFMALIEAGVMQASSTIDAKIRQATSSGGAGAKDVTGKAITQVTQAGSGSGTVSVINFSGGDLDSANGFNYVQVSITVGAAATLLAAKLLALPSYEPADQFNATAVTQIVG
jgi:hypothetical protein